MGFLFAPKVQSQQTPAVTGIQIQTSCYGKVIALVYGTCRVAGNLIWYGNFFARALSSTGAGKGGGSSGGTTSYIYFAGVAHALCEGPIYDVPTFYANKTKGPPSLRPWVVFDGTFPQTPWTYLTAAHPDDAYGYNGVAYIANPQISLGTDPNLPNVNWEVVAIGAQSVSGKQDADPSVVVTDFLTNAHHGAGFPSARLGDLTNYQNYALSAGLLVSFALSDQSDAASVLNDLAIATNSEFVWSSGVLTVVPYGDEALSGNGKSYTPPAAPEYDLTDDDFLPSGSSTNTDDPVNLVRKRPADAINSLQLEFTDRSADYNTAIAQADDQAAIDLYGLRQSTASNTHMFCDAAAANTSVRLLLQRNSIRNTYQWTTDERYILLDVMNIVTLTDPAMGLNRQWVRITEIDLNDDGTLTFSAEEYLAGTASAATYSFQTGNGYNPDFNVDPGDANAPVIADVPVQIAPTGLETWIAASGSDSGWGGCDVWISADGDNYKSAGTINGSCRQGVLTAALAAGSDPDTVHTLSVDLTESDGILLSGTQNDADQGNTLCVIGGEFISYQTATLTGPNKYDLTYIRRGMYGSPVQSHSIGDAFARLDASVLKYSYDKSQIGQTIYVKLLSFNLYGNATQSLADVSAYTHVLAGPPVPSMVTNFTVQQNGNSVNFAWTQIADFALKGYDIAYAPQGDTDWSDFTLLTEASKGTEMTNAAVPAGTWTFGIRARDIADQLGPLATFDLVIVNENDTTTVQQQEPDWAGSMVGFIRHWTGRLIPDSTTLANHTSDYTIFNTFVPDPVATATYTTPTYDIGFENALRIHWQAGLTAGPGQSGGAIATAYLDSWTSGSDPGVYVPWTVGTVPVRFLNMKVSYSPSAGSVAYLNDFTYTVDRSPVIEQTQVETIAPGGTTVTFPQPFHEAPSVIPSAISATGLYASASSITTSGCVVNIWDHTGTSVGGSATVQATGF